jgi:pimeloyl-ACP methyl ester carboxylesterase
MIEPYRIDIDPAVIADLRDRLARARLADEPDRSGWDYGVSATYLRELVAYWREQFDWDEQQRRLNERPHFMADVERLRIHFVHQRSADTTALPLLLIHGWPSGFPEMTKLLARLTDFHVVVPTLPGFGFSPPARERGVGYARVADALHRLMTDGLGYTRFGLHGTGLGAYVNGWITYDRPHAVVGFHTHDPALVPLPSFDPPEPPMTPEEQAFRERSRQWAAAEGAYAEVQRTKPQSLGHALTDSPAGLAGWLLDKHRTWSDCHGDIESRYTKDELLTGFTIYWGTGTIASSMRAYYERVHCDPPLEPGRRFAVPTGVAMPRDEPGFPPRRAPRAMIERVHDVRHWVDLPRGGHFASWEEPDLVADSIRTFFTELR